MTSDAARPSPLPARAPEAASAEPLRRRAIRRAGEALLLAIPLIGLLELAAHAYFARRPPTFDDWALVRAPALALREPDDIIVVAPRWIDPLVRRALGDAAMPIRDLARPDVTRYASALEISIFGESASELDGWREVARERHGKLLLRRLVNPSPSRVVFDFADHIGPERVDVRGTDPPITCPWNPRAQVIAGGLGGNPTFPPARFECPVGAFFNVGVTIIADQDYQPRRCIWSHPLQRGELVTRFRGVPLGDVIRGHGGMYWPIEREKTGAPVTLIVRVDGDEVGRFKHADGDGWSLFEMPLGVHARSPSSEVEFAVSSTNYNHRHFCFEADTR